MNIILDTHTFLWNGLASPKLSEYAQVLIQNTASQKYLSIASPWEVRIKISVGKFQMAKSVDAFFEEQMRFDNVQFLPITLRHLTCVSTLSLHHHDPFDRLIIAQSLTENIPLVSADAALDAYGIVRLW